MKFHLERCVNENVFCDEEKRAWPGRPREYGQKYKGVPEDKVTNTLAPRCLSSSMYTWHVGVSKMVHIRLSCIHH